MWSVLQHPVCTHHILPAIIFPITDKERTRLYPANSVFPVSGKKRQFIATRKRNINKKAIAELTPNPEITHFKGLGEIFPDEKPHSAKICIWNKYFTSLILSLENRTGWKHFLLPCLQIISGTSRKNYSVLHFHKALCLALP